MEREGNRARVEHAVGDDELAIDDQEFASVEDTGPEPGENPAVDDV